MSRLYNTLNAAVLITLGAASCLSCILPEKCIFIYKTGHRWTGRVAGTAIRTESESTNLIDGKFTDCKADDEHGILAAGDASDPQYIALRDELLADAALDCAKQAGPDQYKPSSVKCDPFSKEYTLTTTVEPDGTCTLFSETTLVKGSRDECIGPEASVDTSSAGAGVDDAPTSA